MKFGQLIEHNMRNIILEKPYTKCDGETNSRPSSGKLKLTVFLDQQPKNLYSFFLLHGKLRAIETYWNWAADHLLVPHMKPLRKINRSGTSPPLPHFLHNFWRKIFLLFLLTRFWHHGMDFEIDLIFLIKPFFLHYPKDVIKT